MRVGLITVLIVAIVSAVAGALGGAWTARAGSHTHASSFHDVVHHKLGLSAAEEQRLQPIEASYETERRQLEQRVRRANSALAVAISEGGADGEALHAASLESKAALAALQDLSVRHLISMRAALDPSHHAAFDAALATALAPPSH